jgi:hypothetical protein
MGIIRHCSLRLAGALTLFIAGSTSAAAPPHYYLYKGQRVNLELNREALSVRYHTDKSHPQQLREAASLGVAVASATPMSVTRWHLLNLAAPLADESDADSRIRMLANGPDVDFVSPVFKEKNGSPILMTQQVLVRFRPEHVALASSLIQTITPELSVVEENYGGMPGAYMLKSSSRNGFDVLASANKLAEGGYTEWAEPDMIISGEHDLIPNDPGFSRLWGIHNTGQSGGVAGMDMKGDLAWNITTGDTSVKVMVIDVGVQQDHPDIHQVPGVDFTGQGGNGGPVNSCDNHGTAVAGCVSATINNGVGIVGIAPNCNVISARTLIANSSCDNSFTAQISWTVNALAYAASHGIRISNFSGVFGTTSSALDAEYQYTHDNAGMIHFAAAGNGSTAVYYPASIPVVNAVAGLNSKGVQASFSNYGPAVDFAAPADSIYVTDRTGSAGYTNGDYYMYRGTSFASPYAAGVAALILSRFPSFTSQQVEAKMRNSCVDLGAPGFDVIYGWGFVNAYNAVRSSCILTPPANITVPVDPGQCGGIVNYPSPTSSGNCGPITCTPPSGSFFSVGTTWVVCSDTSGNQCEFPVTVTGGNLNAATLRDDFNRPDGPLPGSNKWALIQNQPNSGSMSIVNNAIQPTSSAGVNNFGGVVWDSLAGPGTEMSLTVAQKGGDFNSTSFIMYARMNNKDYNTGTGYRLRFFEQPGTDILEIQRVGPGYPNYVVLASTSLEINPGDVVTFRVLCDNQTMVALVNGNQIMAVTDAVYNPSQWYFAVRACVFPTPLRLDNFSVSSPQLGPPSAPVLLSPVTGSTIQPVSPTLSWNSSPGASTYRIQVASDPGFGTIILDDSTLTGTSRQVGPLSNNATYYWHVSAKNNLGGSSYSPTWNFTTAMAPPLPPVLLSPASGSIDQPMTVTLTWNASATAATYRVQVSTDSLFGTTVLNDSTVTTTSRQVGPLANSTKYYWRVNAKNAGGTSSYSSVWNFTTVAGPAPPPPVLGSPANGAACQPSTVTLTWTASPGAAKYRVQLANDSLFTLITVDDSTVTTTSRLVSSLAGGTTYYWRVSAINTGGPSPFSPFWRFTTFLPGTLRDNFNRPDGPLSGSNKWALILNQPSAGAMNIATNAIQPTSSAGNTNFGGVVWDSLMSAGSEASLTVVQKSGNFVYTSLFIYARMNNKDYNTGTGYRLRYFEQSGTDILEIHRVGTGYANSTTIGSKSIEINAGDVITFRVLCDNKTLVALVNGAQVLSVVDSVYMPSQWYFAVRACVLPTPARFDDFRISGPPPLPSVTRPVVPVKEKPGMFLLEQNYPDPFNPSTTLRYSLPVDAHVELKVYNILGQEVRTLVDGIQNAGVKQVVWNSTNNAGMEIPGGVYFYELRAQSVAGNRQAFREVKKMLLLR